LVRVLLVHQDEDHVEPAEQRGGDARVLVVVVARVPLLRLVRVRGGDDGGAAVYLAGDAALGDADGLLLHRFVDAAPVLRLDQRELVDAADAEVGQHQRARLDHVLVAVLEECHGQPRGSGADARGHDRAHRDLGGETKQLRLARAWLADHQHVDLASDAGVVLVLLLDAANDRQQNAQLFWVSLVDVGTNALYYLIFSFDWTVYC